MGRIFFLLCCLVFLVFFIYLKSPTERFDTTELAAFADSISELATDKVVVEFVQNYTEPGIVDVGFLNTTLKARIVGIALVGYKGFDFSLVGEEVHFYAPTKEILSIEKRVDWINVSEGWFNTLTKEQLQKLEDDAVLKIENHPLVVKALKTENSSFFNSITAFKGRKIVWNYGY
ncbi:MAG TPA: hypothetical protein PKD00_00705 [Burkholderiales bacterium]|nr:hypothetical protein [Burkholderiales bacterium]